VPSDPRFGTEDLSWEQPQPGAGQLQDVSYPDQQSTNPVGSHPLAVFLPPGYDPNRSTPYPTLYLSHGAGGNEVDWSTQGAANSILVNLMEEHKVQPMVIVMTDFNNLGTCTGQDVSCYQTDINDYVVPYVQTHYDVSKSPSDMAFGGLSAGGERANYLLFNDTDEFGYMASWSIGSGGAPATTSSLWSNPDLKTRLGLVIGGGLYDSITQGTIASYEANLTSFGIPFTDDQIVGGHEWYTWRQLLYDYLTKVAFRTTTTSVTVGATGSGGGQGGWARGHEVKTEWSGGSGSGGYGRGQYGGGNGNCHGGQGGQAGSGPGHGGQGGGWGTGWGTGGGSSQGTSVSATVTPATTETTAPTGTVQFSVNGQPSGQPVQVVNGVAQTTIQNLSAGASITAAYSGDSFYNASTSAAASQTSSS
jgi:enterochelin esterase-like enzyme